MDAATLDTALIEFEPVLRLNESGDPPLTRAAASGGMGVTERSSRSGITVPEAAHLCCRPPRCPR